MPTLRYRISTRVRNGQAEVLARFYDGAFSQRAKTHIPAPVDAWDDEAGALIIPKRTTPESVAIRETQRQLDALADAVCEAWWRDQYEAREGWLQGVIDEFQGVTERREQQRKRLRMADCIIECSDAKDIVKRAKDHYKVLSGDIERYERKHRRLYTDDFTEEDIEGFVRFLANEEVLVDGKKVVKTRSRNTISAKLKKLAAVCRYAVAKGYMPDTPFGEGKYKIPGEVYGDPIYLTLAERDALYAFKDLPDWLKVQRDIFVFQCHIGCRVSDLLELTEANITTDGFVQYIQHKMRKSRPIVVRVPLSDTALEIIERYKGQPNGRLLPFIHEHVYNESIHTMLRLAKLERIVMVQDPKTLQTVPKKLWEVGSSHLARRTFMANMFKETKSERITAAFTGHVNGSRAFSRYTHVDDEMKVEALKNMNQKK